MARSIRIVFLLLLQVLLPLTQAFQREYLIDLNGINTIYIDSEQKYNWFQAERECILRKMSLISINSAEKNAILDGILKKEFQLFPYLWIGGNDLGSENEFVWTASARGFNFTNWRVGAPDNLYNKEHCVHITHNRDWNDIDCTYKLGFICEN
ncbi:lectin subunit alpha [Musca domestica]|uniref:Lectin subunit alpha n=1 Tax=Musca domestica TaxID=7370 RepID=A0A1I8NFI5_MUSDO|nr:lectin subunit alpha [Musca domestica]